VKKCKCWRLSIIVLLFVISANCCYCENCALLGHYSASSGYLLPTFRDNLTMPCSVVKNPKKLVCCPDTSVWNCHYSLHNDPEERSSKLFRGGSLGSHKRVTRHTNVPTQQWTAAEQLAARSFVKIRLEFFKFLLRKQLANNYIDCLHLCCTTVSIIMLIVCTCAALQYQ